MKLSELITASEIVLKELEVLRGKAIEAGDDAEAKKVADGAVAEKETEWEALKGKIEQAKIDAKRAALLAEAKTLAAVELQGKNLSDPPQWAGDGGEPKVPAGQNVEDPAAAAKMAFFNYVQGKDLSPREQELVTPKSTSFSVEGGKGGVVMPPDMASAIFGTKYQKACDILGGKTMLSTQVSPASLIPEEFIRQILQLPSEPASLIDWVTIVPSSTGTLTIPRLVQTDQNEFGGVIMTWIGEGAEKPETEPVFTQETVPAHELAGYTEISLRMLSRSAFDLQAFLTQLYREAVRNELARVIALGSGVGQPDGVVGFAGVRTVARQVGNQVSYQDLVNLKHLLMSYHRAGSRWLVDDTVEQHLEGLTDTTNRPLFNTNVATGMVDRLVGYPYLITERTPNIGASGDVIFGDWRYYWMVVEQEVVVKRSDHFKFRNNLAAFSVYAVVGGEPIQPRAFAYLVGPGS